MAERPRPAPASRLATGWSAVTRRLRFVIIVASCASLALAGVALKLLSRADGNFRLAHGTKSREASKKMATRFPGFSRANTLVLLARAHKDVDDLASLGSSYCAWELELRDAVLREFGPSSSGDSGLVRAVDSFCALDAANETLLAAGFLDTQRPFLRGARAATISISYNAKAAPSDRYRLGHWAKRRARTLRDTLAIPIAVGSTGLDPLLESGIKGTKKDLEGVDSRALPVALGVMAWTLGSLTMLVLPIANMLFATVVEFAIMSVVALHYDVVAFAPSVMMTLTLAVSFDYSLFLCSRYLEARRDAALSPADRVAVVLDSAGHTVIVSGTTLVCCFLGLLLFSSSVLRGVGVSVGVGLTCALAFNLMLTPAVLHAVGEPLCALQDRIDAVWARVLGAVTSLTRRRPSSRGRAASDENDGGEPLYPPQEAGGDGAAAPSGYVPLGDCTTEEAKVPPGGLGVRDDDGDDASAASGDAPMTTTTTTKTRRSRGEMQPNIFERLTRFLWDDRRVAALVVVLVVGASMPSCRYCLSIRSIAEPTALSPSPTPTERIYRRVKDAFGGGSVAPYFVLFDVPSGKTALSDEVLDAADEVIFGDLVSATKTAAGPLLIVSPTRLGDSLRLHARDYAFCAGRADDAATLTATEQSQLLAVCPSVNALARDYATPDGSSLVARVQLQSSAYSRAGLAWLKDARRALSKSHDDDYFAGVYLDGAAAQLADVISGLYADFPVVIGVTLGVVFGLLGVAFRSVAVPARSVVALCLTLSFSFGSCVQIYQRRSADEPTFLSTRGDGKGLAWLSPLICFSIIVGLALDYDVFLLARVHEFRFGQSCPPLDDRGALLAAVARTGVVITSAGVIMAVSFGALFLSSACILNQCAYLLSIAVLYDTFIIRTLFMPSLISLMRSYAWWPSTGPPVDDDDDSAAVGSRGGDSDPVAVAVDDDDTTTPLAHADC